jgi:hypothetical protein
MRFTMLRLLSLLALFLLACDSTPPITPDAPPDGGQGGSSSSTSVSSSVASSGSQGAGTGGAGGSAGGLSCDPCQDADGSRIVHRRQVTTTLDGYKRVVEAGMFDVLRNEACAPTIAADGVLRCLPAGLAYPSYYADAACTLSLFSVVVGPCVKPPMYGGEVISPASTWATCTTSLARRA